MDSKKKRGKIFIRGGAGGKALSRVLFSHIVFGALGDALAHLGVLEGVLGASLAAHARVEVGVPVGGAVGDAGF